MVKKPDALIQKFKVDEAKRALEQWEKVLEARSLFEVAYNFHDLIGENLKTEQQKWEVEALLEKANFNAAQNVTLKLYDLIQSDQKQDFSLSAKIRTEFEDWLGILLKALAVKQEPRFDPRDFWGSNLFISPLDYFEMETTFSLDTEKKLAALLSFSTVASLKPDDRKNEQFSFAHIERGCTEFQMPYDVFVSAVGPDESVIHGEMTCIDVEYLCDWLASQGPYIVWDRSRMEPNAIPTSFIWVEKGGAFRRVSTRAPRQTKHPIRSKMITLLFIISLMRILRRPGSELVLFTDPSTNSRLSSLGKRLKARYLEFQRAAKINAVRFGKNTLGRGHGDFPGYELSPLVPVVLIDQIPRRSKGNLGKRINAAAKLIITSTFGPNQRVK
jgi:hypothetical protein